MIPYTNITSADQHRGDFRSALSAGNGALRVAFGSSVKQRKNKRPCRQVGSWEMFREQGFCLCKLFGSGTMDSSSITSRR